MSRIVDCFELPWKLEYCLLKARGEKTWIARKHCYPEIFCVSGKLLCVQQKNLLICHNPVRTVRTDWDLSGQLEKLTATVEYFRMKLSGFFQMISHFPDGFKPSRLLQIISHFPVGLKIVQIFSDDFPFSGRFQIVRIFPAHGSWTCIKRKNIIHGNFFLFSCKKKYIELYSKRLISGVEGVLRKSICSHFSS